MAVKASPKSKSVWFCTSCGNEFPKWMGQCPACKEWNTLQEREMISGVSAGRGAQHVPGGSRKPVRLREVEATGEDRISLGSAEVDRLLGGGIVKGSLVLIGGEPGIGKSTLSLQIPLSCNNLRTLYVTGEESGHKVGIRLAMHVAEEARYTYSMNLNNLTLVLSEHEAGSEAPDAFAGQEG